MKTTVYDFFKALDNAGLLEQFYKCKILNPNMRVHYQRYCYYKDLLKYYRGPETNYHRVLDTSIHFNVSEQTIYKAIRLFQEEIGDFFMVFLKNAFLKTREHPDGVAASKNS